MSRSVLRALTAVAVFVFLVIVSVNIERAAEQHGWDQLLVTNEAGVPNLFASTPWWMWLALAFSGGAALALWVNELLPRKERPKKVVTPPNGRLSLCLRSFGEFQNVMTKREYFSLGSDHGGEQQFIAIYVPFVFSKERLLDIVMIRATITGYIANKLAVVDRIAMQKSYDYEWRDTSFIDIHHVPEDRIEIPVAFISTKSGNPGVYGDKSLNGYYFSEGTAHFIEITLFSVKKRQRHTVQIFMPFTTDCNDPILGINSGRFLIFENEKLPTPA